MSSQHKSKSKNQLKAAITPLLAMSLFVGCSKDSGDKKEPPKQVISSLWQRLASDLGGDQSQQSEPMRVTDLDGNPIANAKVLIGDGLNSPFVSNFIEADQQGMFLAPTGWTTAQVVTVSAPGYVRASYFGQIPRGQSFQLRQAVQSSRFELKGVGTGFQVKDKDDLADFALVMPAMNRQALFGFDMSMFISPINDTIEVYGNKMGIPSNVTLPRQKENYGIFPVTLEKPTYRMYFPNPGKKAVFAARGQFPFKKVVGQLQGNQQFIDLINDFSIKGGALRNVDISAPTQNLDLPVTELVFNQKKVFKSPVFNSDEFLLAIPLSDYQGNLIPTDLKNVPSNTNNSVTTAAGSKPNLLIVLKKKSEQDNLSGGRLTAAIVPFDENLQPVLLPMLESPTIVDYHHLKVKLPAIPNGIYGSATYSVLSKVDSKVQQGITVESLAKVWEVYASEWQAEINLPVWPDEAPVEGKKRWEVTLVGSQQNKSIDLNPSLFETVTHATHGATDF